MTMLSERPRHRHELNPVRMALGPEILVRDAWMPEPLADRLRGWDPKTDLGRYCRLAVAYLPNDLAIELIEAVRRSVVMESRLYARVFRELLYRPDGLVDDYGLVSKRVVTDAGAQFIADAFRNTVEPETMKYHGIGTGSTAEAASQPALVTELTTQYSVDNTRATGTLATGATNNVFRSIATNTVDVNGLTITEHSLFTQAAAPGGTMLDRSLLSPTVGLNNGDGLQNQYDISVVSGG